MARSNSVATTASSGRVRGVSKNPAEARRRILESAILIFGARGFARTTTEEIAEHAGYGQATIFFHFKTKGGLLEACLEDALDKARATLVPVEASDTLDLVQRLDLAFENAPTAAFLGRMLTEFGETSSIRPVYAAFHHQVRQLLAAALSRDTGAPEDDAYPAAAAILAAMVGVHAEQRLDTRRISAAAFRSILLNITTLIVRDLAERGRPTPKPREPGS